MQTVVEISRSALEHNVRQIRGQLGASTKLSLVLKSNAYGHGTEEVLRVVGPLADVIAVVDGSEALEVRALGYTGRLSILSILDEVILPELLEASVE
ncbi:MAG: alanine racemase, partial [Candidatus Doudnabacteria bacterium]|nr:alanine racemase [Candidatus Doudnabacteria bacterium]